MSSPGGAAPEGPGAARLCKHGLHPCHSLETGCAQEGFEALAARLVEVEQDALRAEAKALQAEGAARTLREVLRDAVQSHEPCIPDACWCIEARAALATPAALVPKEEDK